MERLLKPFAVSAIALRRNVFLAARLKLTALYVAILIVIVAGFSLFLYTSIVKNLQDTNADDFANQSAHDRFIENTIEPIQHSILLIDLFVIVGVAGVSYWLAGVTLRPVKRSLDAQRLFAAQASHELRTPLTVIQNEAEVALRSPHTTVTELRSTLESSLEEILKMTTLTEDLLSLARSEQREGDAMGKVSVQKLIKNTVKKLEPLSLKKSIALNFDVPTEFSVPGDEHALERLFTNLIRNSIEHTFCGAITLTARREDSQAIFIIDDTGEGIPADQLPYIFERFYKGSSSSGNGLGLSIVQEIIAQHKGTIIVDSVISQGTTVRVRLPTG